MAKVRFRSVDDVKNFVRITEKYDSPVDVHLGRYNCDGSSLMGILGLDLNHVLEVEMLEQNNTGERESFLAEIKNLGIVEEE